MASSFEMRDIVGVVRQMSKGPNNRIVLKCQGTILTVNVWTDKEKNEHYKYQAFLPDFQGVVEFSSKRKLLVGKPADLVLTLIDFRAYEDVR